MVQNNLQYNPQATPYQAYKPMNLASQQVQQAPNPMSAFSFMQDQTQGPQVAGGIFGGVNNLSQGALSGFQNPNSFQQYALGGNYGASGGIPGLNNLGRNVSDMGNVGTEMLTQGAGIADTNGAGRSFWDRLVGGKDAAGNEYGGFAMPAIKAIGGGMNAFLGLKQLGVMEDSLKFQKRSFDQQYNAQRTDVNRRMEDRQNARVAASSGGVMSTEDYMKKHRIT